MHHEPRFLHCPEQTILRGLTDDQASPRTSK